ncbi:MAG: tetratricopeptide repeat protein [Gammaproteobacteria bacterium]|nr:tetratricopeptide repeat protein [Gammaproteobacteria bacterium]
MRRRFRAALIFSLLTVLLVNAGLALAIWVKSDKLEDLYFGEAIYYGYQEAYFDAIVRLDTELAQHYALDQPSLDSLSAHRSEAEFDVGDLELSYRMHQRAGRAIQRVLDAEGVPQSVRNEAAYRLARIYYAKGYYINAAHALDLIGGEVSKPLAERADLLRGQVQMTQMNYKQAIKLLKPLRKSSELNGYAAFNLGVAYLRDGQLQKGIAQLDEIGKLAGNDAETVALRDKANLTLGNRLLEEGRAAEARPYLERVRLDGPFSNKSLLWAGWADAALQKYDRALVPWTELQKRDPSDAAVQEALLALPYAYAQLEGYGQAALLYGQAVNEFEKEIDRLDSSMSAILNGKFKRALLRDPDERTSTFFQNLRAQGDAPETRYLLDLMASNDFQESVKNFRDMEQLRLNTLQWMANINAYQDLINVRRQYFVPLLPVIEKNFKTQDALLQSVLLRRDEVARHLNNAQKSHNVRAFATQAELSMQRRMDRVAYKLGRMQEQPGLKQAKARLARLQGTLSWQIETDYDKRLEKAHKDLVELDELIGKLREQHQVIVRMKREAYQSYEGYEVPLRRLSTRLQSLNNNAAALMQQQAGYLEKVAVRELDRRRRKLADYRVKARFALAESYDRATKKQAKEAEDVIREQQKIQEIQADDDVSPAAGGTQK